jgi:hydrogenase expression/formation protein HypD
MEFCGGHTHAICRYGIEDLLPPNLRLIHGPGCPVCVLPSGRLQAAIDLAERERVILCSYGDLLRVPGAQGDTLLKAKARGADVRMVYSVSDALDIARAHPDQSSGVFFAIGFETTTPPTAVALRQARATSWATSASIAITSSLRPRCERFWRRLPRENRRFNPLTASSAQPTSAPSSAAAYEFVAAEYHRPLVIAGFEPLDVLQSILMLIRQINAGEARVENEYTRAVSPAGNRKAQRLMAKCSRCRSSFEWRGLGELPNSALAIRPEFADMGRRAPLHRAPFVPPIIRPAPAPKCCAASSARKSARCSPRPVPRIIRWVPAWCRLKAPARRIITMADFG